jgi:multicomponent Na+:H+ antiporter subunit E
VILVLAAWRLGDAGGAEGRLRLWRLPVFVPLFVWRPLVGSCDVAWRALDGRMPIDPVLYDYALRLPVGGPARVFFANCINLLPGTLTASWNDDMLRVHVLTSDPQAMSELRKLERQIALLFGHTRAHGQEDTFV